MADSIIKVSNLSKTYKVHRKEPGFVGSLKSLLNRKYEQVQAVKDISFEIQSGELIGFIGPNGAGKTTTMRIIASLIKPDSGNVYLNDIDVVSNPGLIRSKLAFLTTDLKLDLKSDANSLYDFFSDLYHIPSEQSRRKKEELFGIFGIDKFADTKIAKLSQGMRQKVSIALSVIHDPPFVIFDEPTNGLDVVASRDVRDFIFRLKNEGKCVIISTHIFDLVEKLCDKAAMIIDGKLIVQGNLEDIMQGRPLEEAFYDYYKENHKF